MSAGYFLTLRGNLRRYDALTQARHFIASHPDFDEQFAGAYYINEAGEARHIFSEEIERDGIYILLQTAKPVARDQAVATAHKRWCCTGGTLQDALAGLAGIIYQSVDGDVRLHVTDLTVNELK